jgi:hypothetical protein
MQGWLVFKDPDRKNETLIEKDLKKNKLLIFQHKYYLLISLITGNFLVI